MAVSDLTLGEPFVQVAEPSSARGVGKVAAGLLAGLGCAALWAHGASVQQRTLRADLDEMTLARVGVTPTNFVQLFPPPSAARVGGMAQVEFMQDTLKKYGVSSSPMQKLALTQLAATRDPSMKAQVKEVFSELDPSSQGKLRKISKEIVVRASGEYQPGVTQEREPAPIRTMVAPGVPSYAELKAKKAASLKDHPGVTPPFGFWDPLDLSINIPDARLRWFAEAELKNGRVAMMAVLGIVVASKFQMPIGDKPAYTDAMGDSVSLEYIGKTFWPSLVIACGFAEFFSSPDGSKPPGDLGFDPLGLRPTDPKEYLELQRKEINNARLAMMAWAGIIGKQLMTGEAVF